VGEAATAVGFGQLAPGVEVSESSPKRMVFDLMLISLSLDLHERKRSERMSAIYLVYGFENG
jgi:hypothetical protein